MAGCYGSSAEDRYYERMLDNWLDSQEDHRDEFREEARELAFDEIDNHSDEYCEWLFDKYGIDEYELFVCDDDMREAYADYREDDLAEMLMEKAIDEEDGRMEEYYERIADEAREMDW